MSKTGIVFSEEFLNHKTGEGHPERPERLRYLGQHLQQTGLLSELVRIPTNMAEIHSIANIHPMAYIEQVRAACQSGLHHLDADTVVCQASFETALLAAGSVLNACDAVMNGEVDNVFCAVRPPGHHAEPNRAMGFCMFNNVAITARYLQKEFPIQKVAIVDWDVHHGNGTQNAFYEDASVFYISVHQRPLYPGTGRAEERGNGAGVGATLNLPQPPGSGDQDYRVVFDQQIIPALQKFEPEFLLISAGFDAHTDDPLANMELTEEGFVEMTTCLKDVAAKCCHGRMVSLLEGGYNLMALARSVEVHLRNLQN
ncbi:MAG: histone deacetylase [bacterium]